MACPTGFEEWTFDLTVDGASQALRLNFCMKFEGIRVSGEVFDPLPTPVKLSDLMGLRVPIVGGVNDTLSLEFKWDKVRVFMSGFTFVQGKDKFAGNFVLTGLTDALNAPDATQVDARGAETSTETSAEALFQLPPDPGDTGVGN